MQKVSVIFINRLPYSLPQLANTLSKWYVMVRVGGGTLMSLDMSDVKPTNDKLCTEKNIHLFI